MILKLHIGLVIFLILYYNLFAQVYTRVPIVLFLLCRYVKARLMGISAEVFSKQLNTNNKENYNIARGHIGYRRRNGKPIVEKNVKTDCKNAKNDALFLTLIALKTSILTFHYYVCSN